MIRVVIYSLLLIVGMAFTFFVDFSSLRWLVSTLTMLCLSYIMIEVGLEFTIDKRRLKSYGKDYLVAATAALFPWIFCALYFIYIFEISFDQALLLGRFAAPTSAGILFAMLAAAGLGTSWLFQKARILAIFDDLDTILLMIPLQIMVVGIKWQLLLILPFVIISLFIAYRYLHTLKWPMKPWYLLGYGLAITLISQGIYASTEIHIEVLLPAFLLGCILYNPHDPNLPQEHRYEHEYIEPERKVDRLVDGTVKYAFMLLVGMSLPRIELGENTIGLLILNVVLITILSNIGKMFPSLCYRKEASVRERLALSVSMFPRGEVGAGILLVTLDYGIKASAINVAALSLALNLVLTGLFIWTAVALVKPTKA